MAQSPHSDSYSRNIQRMLTRSGINKFEANVTSRGRSERLVVERIERPVLVLGASIDTSGSMKGKRTATAIAGLESILRNGAMLSTDLFSAYTFDKAVRKLHHPIPIKDVDLKLDFERIRENGGGSTALYDAITAGVSTFANKFRTARNTLFFQHLVVTDGADNSSQSSLEAVSKLISNPGFPNYHLYLIAVNIDMKEQRVMQRMCAGANHCKFVHVADVDGLRNELATVERHIRLRLEVKTKKNAMTTTTTTTWEGPQGDVPEALKSLASGSRLLARDLSRDLGLEFSRLHVSNHESHPIASSSRTSAAERVAERGRVSTPRRGGTPRRRGTPPPPYTPRRGGTPRITICEEF